MVVCLREIAKHNFLIIFKELIMTIALHQSGERSHLFSAQPARQGYEILRAKDVCNLLGCSLSMLYLYLDPNSKYYLPTFPKRIKLSERIIGWKAEDIYAFIDNLGKGE